MSTSTTVSHISGDNNTDVLIDSNASSLYQDLFVPRTFMYRSSASNANRKGSYGSFLQLRLIIPPAKAQGTYAGTLVYTIIEN